MAKVRKIEILPPDLTVEEVRAEMLRWFDALRRYLNSPEVTEKLDSFFLTSDDIECKRMRDERAVQQREWLNAQEQILAGTLGRSLIPLIEKPIEGIAGIGFGPLLYPPWAERCRKDLEQRNPTTIEEIVTTVNSILHSGDQEPVRRSFGTYYYLRGRKHWKTPPLWYFKGQSFLTEGPHTEEEFKLLIKEEFDQERRHFERLRHKHEGSETDESYPRQPIPETVRIEVWRRDGGKCARCGSREKLEYDHMVPVSKGGSNTTRNIELLCEQCNRSKGATIC